MIALPRLFEVDDVAFEEEQEYLEREALAERLRVLTARAERERDFRRMWNEAERRAA